MTLDKLIVLLSGIAGVLLTYWFFLGKKDRVVEVADSIDITVEGGYSPSTLSVSKDKPVTLTFIRKDPNACLEELVMPDFKIKRNLPLNEKVSVQLTPKQAGEFVFHCGMNMYHGKIIVNG